MSSAKNLAGTQRIQLYGWKGKISPSISSFQKLTLLENADPETSVSVGKVYAVKTCRYPGLAKLEAIFHDDRLQLSYCRFTLYVFPQFLNSGIDPSFDENELFIYNEAVTVSCKDLTAWFQDPPFIRNFGVRCLPLSALDPYLNPVNAQEYVKLKDDFRFSQNSLYDVGKKHTKNHGLELPIKILTSDDYREFLSVKAMLLAGHPVPLCQVTDNCLVDDNTNYSTYILFASRFVENQDIKNDPIFTNVTELEKKIPSTYFGAIKSFFMKTFDFASTFISGVEMTSAFIIPIEPTQRGFTFRHPFHFHHENQAMIFEDPNKVKAFGNSVSCDASTGNEPPGDKNKENPIDSETVDADDEDSLDETFIRFTPSEYCQPIVLDSENFMKNQGQEENWKFKGRFSDDVGKEKRAVAGPSASLKEGDNPVQSNDRIIQKEVCNNSVFSDPQQVLHEQTYSLINPSLSVFCDKLNPPKFEEASKDQDLDKLHKFGDGNKMDVGKLQEPPSEKEIGELFEGEVSDRLGSSANTEEWIIVGKAGEELLDGESKHDFTESVESVSIRKAIKSNTERGHRLPYSEHGNQEGLEREIDKETFDWLLTAKKWRQGFAVFDNLENVDGPSTSRGYDKDDTRAFSEMSSNMQQRLQNHLNPTTEVPIRNDVFFYPQGSSSTLLKTSLLAPTFEVKHNSAGSRNTSHASSSFTKETEATKRKCTESGENQIIPSKRPSYGNETTEQSSLGYENIRINWDTKPLTFSIVTTQNTIQASQTNSHVSLAGSTSSFSKQMTNDLFQSNLRSATNTDCKYTSSCFPNRITETNPTTENSNGERKASKVNFEGNTGYDRQRQEEDLELPETTADMQEQTDRSMN